jgi:hypothetical protein
MSTDNITEWKQKFEQWQICGKSMTAWCREQNISIHTFYYWRKKLRSTSSILSENQNKFIELIDKPNNLSGISLEYCGVIVHLRKDFHSASLINCLQALRKI